MYKFAGRVLNGEGFFVFVRVALRAPAAALSARSPALRSYESQPTREGIVRVTTSRAARGRTRHSVYTVCYPWLSQCESGCVVCVPIFEFSTCTLRYDVLTSLTL